MQKILQLTLIWLVLCCCECNLGVDVSQLFSVQNYTCMRVNNNVTFGVARGYHAYGAIDQNAIQSLTNMKSAGLRADVYMFPCPGKNSTAQVD